MAGKKKSGRGSRNAARTRKGSLDVTGGRRKKKQKLSEGITHANHGAKTHKGFMSLEMK
jgi:hypothetical protein